MCDTTLIGLLDKNGQPVFTQHPPRGLDYEVVGLGAGGRLPDIRGASEEDLPDSFLLNLQRCLLVSPDPTHSTAELATQLAGLSVAGAPVGLLIGRDPEQRSALRQLPRDRGRQWVVPDGPEITRLLLDPDPGQALARTIAGQVPLTRLSPYQTRGGVTKESLYFAASEDYQSPLKNFGASHVLGALEHEACREMVTKPMAALNIRFAHQESSDDLIEQLITATGGRANLVAISCNAILKGLDPGSREITATDLQRGLAEPDLREALGGWGQLGGDAAASRLDQAIVYAMVDRDGFSRAELMDRLEAAGLSFQPEALQQSLLRLELAFILGEQDGRFSYRVPLFREMIRGLEPERSLQRLVEAARA